MIRRYSRRPVCNALEICGLLQSSTDSHPLPDKQGEYSAPSPITSIEDADSTSSGESKISEDANSHLLLADTGRPWTAMNSYTETRLSTACSSTFSWGDNEFEAAASQQVQQMFFEIDELLFEEKKCSRVQRLEEECQEWKCSRVQRLEEECQEWKCSRVQRLEEECQEWKCSFPYFRVLGTQIAAPVNEAYGWYPGREEGKTPLPTSSPGSDTAVTELGVIGKSATFSGLSLCKGNDFMPTTAMLRWEEQEAEPEDNVIIAEGIMEEHLVLHYKDWEDDHFETRLDFSLQYENRSGLPPISPSHCRRDTIVTELFDEVWLEVVGCMEELIRKHWERHVSDEDKNISSTENTGFDPFNFLLPPVPQVQQPHIGMVQTRPNSLCIQGIPFSHRNPPMPEKIEDPDERPVLWPYSSNHSANRFPSNHLLEHSICSLSQPVHSAQRRNAPRTLHPIHSSLSLSRTPVGSIDEVVRGIRLQSVRDCQSASARFLRHNTLLPPIGSTDSDHSAAKLAEQPQKSQIHSNRTRSATIDETSYLPPRDRFLGNKYFTRPKTTHTFRANTDGNRRKAMKMGKEALW